MNEGLKVFENNVGKKNALRVFEMLDILGIKLPDDYGYGILAEFFDERNNWLHWDEFFDYKIVPPGREYCLDLESDGRNIPFDNKRLSKYIFFYKNDRDSKIDRVGIVINEGKFKYNWIKEIASKNEKFWIFSNRLEDVDYTFSFKVNPNIYCTSYVTCSDHRNALVCSLLNNVMIYNGKERSIEEYYDTVVETLNDIYKLEQFPDYITKELLDKICLMYKTPIAELLKSLNYTKKKKKYDEMNRYIEKCRENRLEEEKYEYNKAVEDAKLAYMRRTSDIEKDYMENIRMLEREVPVRKKVPTRK